jgi:hypothetical protein
MAAHGWERVGVEADLHMCRSTRFRDLVDDIAIQHSVHRQQGRFLQQRGLAPYGLGKGPERLVVVQRKRWRGR